MALTDGDRAECKEIGRVIIREVMEEHIKSCPHGQNFNILKAKIYGICIGVSAVSSCVVFILSKIFGS